MGGEGGGGRERRSWSAQVFRLSQQSGWEWDCDALAGFVLTMTHRHIFQTDIFIQALFFFSPP